MGSGNCLTKKVLASFPWNEVLAVPEKRYSQLDVVNLFVIPTNQEHVTYAPVATQIRFLIGGESITCHESKFTNPYGNKKSPTLTFDCHVVRSCTGRVRVPTGVKQVIFSQFVVVKRYNKTLHWLHRGEY